MADGYVGLFKVPSEGSPIPVIDTSTGPTMTAAEETQILDDWNAKSIAILDITDLDITSGVIRQVLIEKSEDAGTSWFPATTVATLDTSGEGLDSSGKSRNISNIKLIGIETDYTSGKTWHFRATFLNGDGVAAVDSSSDIVRVTCNQDFNGLDDAGEIIEVTNLVNNASTGATEGNETTPVVMDTYGIARLQWKDIRTYATATLYITDGETGGTDLRSAGGKLINEVTNDSSNIIVTTAHLKAIDSYEIYLFISDSGGAPVNRWPVTDASDNGTWYYVESRPAGQYGGDMTTSINCPAGKNVAFWVGGRSKRTPYYNGAGPS